MNYMRKVIYLKRWEQGRVMPGQGFVRLEQRAGDFRMHLSMNDIMLPGENPVYIVYKEEEHLYASLIGTTALFRQGDLRCPSGDLPAELPLAHIYGVLIGSSDQYLSGLCPEYAGTLLYEQVTFAGIKEAVSSTEPVPDTAVVSTAEPAPDSSVSSGKGTSDDSVEMSEISSQDGQDSASEEETEYTSRDSFLKGLSEMYPFEDDEVDWCLQMKPEDFNGFPMEYWHYAKNSFLLQGFYNYRHLVYAHIKDKNYVGVPGQFIRKEQYLATRFGFHWFKQIRRKKLSMGDYGYWLREL